MSSPLLTFGINHPVGHQPDSHADLDQFLARFGVADFHKTREPDSRPVQVIVDDPESVASAAVKNETLLAGLGPIHLAGFGPSVMTRHDHPQFIGKQGANSISLIRIGSRVMAKSISPNPSISRQRECPRTSPRNGKGMFFFELRQHRRKRNPAGLSLPPNGSRRLEFLESRPILHAPFPFRPKKGRVKRRRRSPLP